MYSFVPLVDQLIPMGLILLGTSTRTQTTLEYKDSNYPFITLYQNEHKYYSLLHYHLWEINLPLWWATCVLKVSRMVFLYTLGPIITCA